MVSAAAPRGLDPTQLLRRCAPGGLPFRTTDEVEDLDLILGQKRAVDAIRFGVGIARDGYNLFAMGPRGLDVEALAVRQAMATRRYAIM